MVQKVASIALAFGLLAACALAQNTELQAGTVQGLVFTSEQDGGRLVVPGTKISLDGPSHLEAESNNEGKFAINAVPSGAYTVTAHAPGLSATQTTVVSASAVSELALEMKLQRFPKSTTVPPRPKPATQKDPSEPGALGDPPYRTIPTHNNHTKPSPPLFPRPS